jgi:hypothetical protein
VFRDEASKKALKESLEKMTLIKLVEAWLERTPCLTKLTIENGKRVEKNYFLEEFKKGFDRYMYDSYVKPAEV